MIFFNTARLSVLSFSLWALLASSACAPDSVSDESPPTAPTRIVSLAPSITEILFALDAGDLLIGRSMHCKFPDLAANIASVGRIDLPDQETLLAMQPDLVILSGLTPIETEQRLQRLNLRTLRFEHSGLDGLRSDIKAIAAAIGQATEAELFLAQWDARVAAVVAAVEAKAIALPKTVLLYSLDGLYSAGRGSFVGDLIALCGGENIAANTLSPWPQLNREAVLAANPEVILLAADTSKNKPAARRQLIQQLQADAYWQQLSAVQNNRVHIIPADWLTIPGPRTLSAIEAIHTALYP